MLKVVVNAHFGTEPLNERQVSFPVLYAVLAVGVFAAEVKLESIALDAVVLEDFLDNPWHVFALKDALVDAPIEVGQSGHQADLIARQTSSGIALAYAKDLTMDAGVCIERQESLTIEQVFKLDVRRLADQFEVETVGLADCLPARELKHIELFRTAFDRQREARLISESEHPMCLCRRKASDSA